MRYYNLGTDELYNHAKKNHKFNDTNALVAYSGKYTGRCPEDKRIVERNCSNDIWWGDVNKPIDDVLFYYYYIQAHNYFNEDRDVYIIDSYAGWDKENQITVRTICTDPYHALFMKNMLIPANKIHEGKVDLEIVNCSDLYLNEFDNDLKELNINKGDLNENLIGLDLKQGKIVIYGTKYAGEMKKSVLTYMMYKMPIIGNLPLHSSACINPKNDVLTFFGLSGTGKTTLSASKGLTLIGDDEHVWTNDGIFNIEGGCYAKCLGLNEENEPEIYNAIKKGAVLENVVLNKDNSVNYNDKSITYNTRCAYPLDHLDNILIPATIKEHPKNIILLVCDAFGLLPAISKLTAKQAVFYFLLGYTCKMPGTEKGIDKPLKTYSACFAEPFLIWQPEIYGNMLMDKIKKHECNVWLLNTGWLGNGKRMPLKYTRQIVNMISDNTMDDQLFLNFPYLNINIPKSIEGIPGEYLTPYLLWKNRETYYENLIKLITEFNDVFIKKMGKELYNNLMEN
jgi:phosphoenolpyruvate carboxykinase (ATP)